MDKKYDNCLRALPADKWREFDGLLNERSVLDGKSSKLFSYVPVKGTSSKN
jgi:hypothetical protein